MNYPYRIPVDDTHDGSVFMYCREVCRCLDVSFSIVHCQGHKFYEVDLGDGERYFYKDGSPAFMLFCEFQSLRLTGDFLCQYDHPDWPELGDGRGR